MKLDQSILISRLLYFPYPSLWGPKENRMELIPALLSQEEEACQRMEPKLRSIAKTWGPPKH